MHDEDAPTGLHKKCKIEYKGRAGWVSRVAWHAPYHETTRGLRPLLCTLDLSISQSASAVANRHLGPPRARVIPCHSSVPFWSCRVRVSQNTDGVTSLHRTLIVFIDSQCNGLIRKGASRLTLSPREQRTARCLSTYPPLSDHGFLGGCWGRWRVTRRSSANFVVPLYRCFLWSPSRHNKWNKNHEKHNTRQYPWFLFGEKVAYKLLSTLPCAIENSLSNFKNFQPESVKLWNSRVRCHSLSTHWKTTAQCRTLQRRRRRVQGSR